MGKPSNNLLKAMELASYGVADMLPAFPGKDIDYVQSVLEDNALCLNRPVISYGLLAIDPCLSEHFNISEHGFRTVGQIQPWPVPKDMKAIFIFGGSTSLGQNVSDRDSIPSLIRRGIKNQYDNIEVYNFGSGNYSSRHELLRFLDFLDKGAVPDLAVFLDGYNDSFYALGNNELTFALNRLYRAEKRRRQKSKFGALQDFILELVGKGNAAMPMAHTFRVADPKFTDVVSDETIRRRLRFSTPENNTEELTKEDVDLASSVWRSYKRSVRMIKAMTEEFDTRTMHFWQPVPYFCAHPEQRVMERLYPVFRAGGFSWPVYHWLHREGILSNSTGIENFFDLSGSADGFDGVCYLDVCHYSPAFNAVIADRMIEEIVGAL
tara:strand:- start:538 stop:1674 length:1137 start_codon:yes stop_codon:yes gene_type:complete